MKSSSKGQANVTYFCADDKFSDIIEQLSRRGWTRVPPTMPFCDLRWRNYAATPFKRARSGQFLNHLQNAHHLSNKGLLCLHLHEHRTRHLPEVDWFYPQTWSFRHHGLFPFLKDFAVCYAVSTIRRQLSLQRERKQQRLHGFNQCVSYLEYVISLDMNHDKDDVLSSAESTILSLIMKGNGPHSDEQTGEAKDFQFLYKVEDIDNLLLTFSSSQSPKLRNLSKLTDVKNAWILKPAGASCGRGITCSSNLSEILQTAAELDWNCVVQKYIERPYLIQNYKFDVRLWVLVTSVRPLIVWGFEEFYLRFSSKPFEMEDLSDRFVHLCNNSVQKDSDRYDQGLSEGNMWPMSQFEQHIESVHGTGTFKDTLLPKFHHLVIQTISSTKHVLNKKERGFEWLGFDIMIGEDLSLYLLEVNLSPDVSHSTAVTARLVPKACEDLLTLILDEDMANPGQYPPHNSYRIHKDLADAGEPIALHTMTSGPTSQDDETPKCDLKWTLWFLENQDFHKETPAEQSTGDDIYSCDKKAVEDLIGEAKDSENLNSGKQLRELQLLLEQFKM